MVPGNRRQIRHRLAGRLRRSRRPRLRGRYPRHLHFQSRHSSLHPPPPPHLPARPRRIHPPPTDRHHHPLIDSPSILPSNIPPPPAFHPNSAGPRTSRNTIDKKNTCSIL